MATLEKKLSGSSNSTQDSPISALVREKGFKYPKTNHFQKSLKKEENEAFKGLRQEVCINSCLEEPKMIPTEIFFKKKSLKILGKEKKYGPLENSKNHQNLFEKKKFVRRENIDSQKKISIPNSKFEIENSIEEKKSTEKKISKVKMFYKFHFFKKYYFQFFFNFFWMMTLTALYIMQYQNWSRILFSHSYLTTVTMLTTIIYLATACVYTIKAHNFEKKFLKKKYFQGEIEKSENNEGEIEKKIIQGEIEKFENLKFSKFFKKFSIIIYTMTGMLAMFYWPFVSKGDFSSFEKKCQNVNFCRTYSIFSHGLILIPTWAPIFFQYTKIEKKEIFFPIIFAFFYSINLVLTSLLYEPLYKVLDFRKISGWGMFLGAYFLIFFSFFFGYFIAMIKRKIIGIW